MPEEKLDSWEGCKTFFVVPDLSLMPEDFVPTFFAKGFETYYLMDDQHLDLAAKVRVILGLFNDVIFFFNVGRKINGVHWPEFVRGISEEHGERARIGVLCERRLGDEAIAAFERTYLYEIGIFCGCVPLDYRKAKNLPLLAEVLAANEAKGRRSSLRAVCGDTSRLNFSREGHSFRGFVRDVSLSHFSCVFEGSDPELKMYEKVKDIQLNLGGIICSVDAVLFAKRAVGASMLYVFVFRDSRDRDGLDAHMSAKINGFIHRHYEQGVRAALSKGFGEEIARRRERRPGAGSTRSQAPTILAP